MNFIYAAIGIYLILNGHWIIGSLLVMWAVLPEGNHRTLNTNIPKV